MFTRFPEGANLLSRLWVTSMSRRLKIRIETAGISNEEIARLVREVARRIDDGRVHGIIDRDGRPVGAWSFEDDTTVVGDRVASATSAAKVGSLSR